jgi:glycosyltransferase involved in cell wall biosynthesis
MTRTNSKTNSKTKTKPRTAHVPAGATDRVRLAFVGPMFGGHEGWPDSQGEVLADLFESAGYTVRRASDRIDPWTRCADTVRCIWAWRGTVDIAVVSIYGGRSFLQAEAASRTLERAGIKQVHVLHGGSLLDLARRRPGRVARMLRRAEAVVAPSPFLAQVTDLTNVPVRTIPNVVAIDTTPHVLRQTVAPRLLWMRMFASIYAPELAIDTFRLVLRHRPDATLTMAGRDKGELAAIRMRARGYGIDERVHFVGLLDTVGKQREFAAHDIFLNTSRIDNTPVSVIEACAFGLPVIATDVGGLSMLLDHERTGILVKRDDPEAMANAVVRLVGDPALAQRLSASGRSVAEPCSWATVRSQWEGVLCGL